MSDFARSWDFLDGEGLAGRSTGKLKVEGFLRGKGVAGGDNVGSVGEFGGVEGREQEEGFGGMPAGAEYGEEVCVAFGWAGSGGEGGVGGGKDGEESEEC